MIAMALPALARAQEPARRGAGIRVGFWNAGAIGGEKLERSPHIEGYFQRGLDKHLALESSAAVWRIVRGSDSDATRTYIVPLLTSLKAFPVTTPGNEIEPFGIAGIGFVFGIEDQPENLIGGTGTTVVAGFGFRGGLGVELRMSSAFGLSAAGKYQWVRFGEEIGGSESFSGLGVEGGITYRFQF